MIAEVSVIDSTRGALSGWRMVTWNMMGRLRDQLFDQG
jgi:hypothetical protein